MRGFQRDFDFGAKDKQTVLYTPQVQKQQAIDLLEATRAELIAEAKVIAADLCSVRGRVTSVAVLEVMRRGRYAEQLSQVDARFMGAVFRHGWRRVGYEPLGSHCRPVSVWEKV